MSEISYKIAADLLKIKAVQLRLHPPFTWSSGLLSPIYCDNRLTLSFPEVRDHIKEGFIDLIRRKYSEIDAIVGVATGAIAHAALVADALDLPMVYVRSAAKGHGLNNLVEGKLSPGSNCIIIEDLISTGKSSIQAAQAIIQEGYHVRQTLAIFSYGMPGALATFAAQGLQFETLTTFDDLLGIAIRENYLSESERNTLHDWQKNPEGWGKL